MTELRGLRYATVISWIMLIVAVIASAALMLALYPVYRDYVEWTEAVVVEVVAASATPMGNSGTIDMELEFRAPGVGFSATIEAAEFSVYSDGEHCGFYRIRVPHSSGTASHEGATEAPLSLSAPVAKENFQGLIGGRSAVISGSLVVRISLPRKRQRVRCAFEGQLDIVRSDSE